MVIRDIQNFSEIRTKARAYFCYLFSKNLPNDLPEIPLTSVSDRLRKIMGDIPSAEGVYILNAQGKQITPSYLATGEKKQDEGENRASRAYYYRAMKEKRCTITDPYPSLITGELTVTASKPIFDDQGKCLYIACIDIPLDAVLKFTHPTSTDSIFGKVSKFAYTVFSISLALVSLLLFIKGMEGFVSHGLAFYEVTVKNIFESTILLTLSLAIFDLVKTLFEEEVMGRHKQSSFGMNKTMMKFLGSIIIALSIEALMLVFKFAITDPEMIIHAIYIIGAVALLLVGLSYYTSKTQESNSEE